MFGISNPAVWVENFDRSWGGQGALRSNRRVVPGRTLNAGFLEALGYKGLEVLSLGFTRFKF